MPTEEMLAHVLEAIVRFGVDSPVRRALMEAGVETINDLLTLGTEDIAELRYSSADGEPAILKLKALETAKMKKVTLFHAALCHRNGNVTSLEDGIWLSTTGGLG